MIEREILNLQGDFGHSQTELCEGLICIRKQNGSANTRIRS